MEIWDICDKNRNKTGRKHERGKALEDGDYHLVVHVWITNDKGKFLLAKRHPQKPEPNMWECVGGSVLENESSLEGALREVKEEIGIELDEQNGKLLKSERRDNFHDFYDVWLFKQDIDLNDVVMQDDEVIDVKWVTKDELDKLCESGNLVRTLHYYKILFEI